MPWGCEFDSHPRVCDRLLLFWGFKVWHRALVVFSAGLSNPRREERLLWVVCVPRAYLLSPSLVFLPRRLS